jgi:hypothetical protein
MDTTSPVDANALAERIDRVKVAAETVPTREFEEEWNAIKAEKEEIRRTVDQVNDPDLNARFDDLGVTLKQAWPKWNQARFASLPAADQEAGLALRRREAAEIRRLRSLTARATATIRQENRKAGHGTVSHRPSRQARSTRAVTIGRSSQTRRTTTSASSDDPSPPGDDPPSDQLRRWPDEVELSRLSPFARVWRVSLDTLTTVEEFDHLAAQATIRAIWIGRAA